MTPDALRTWLVVAALLVSTAAVAQTVATWNQGPAFAPKTTAPKLDTKLVARGGHQAAISKDSQRMVIPIGGNGVRLYSPSHPRGLQLGKEHVDEVAIAPNGRFGAAADQFGQLSVFSVDSGKVLMRVAGRAPVFVDDHTAQWTEGAERGCTIMAFDVRTDTQPRKIIAPKGCTRVLYHAPGGTHWFVADTGPKSTRFYAYVHRRIWRVDRAGKTQTIATTLGNEYLAWPEVSPTGDRVCAIRHSEGTHPLLCYQTRNPGAPPEMLAGNNALRSFAFDDTGRRLVYRVGERVRGPYQLFVADFQTRTFRFISMDFDKHDWTFLSGGRRLVGDGAKGGFIVLDLAQSWQTVLNTEAEQWQGLFPIPGKDDTFIAGRERGGTRDLYRITLTP